MLDRIKEKYRRYDDKENFYTTHKVSRALLKLLLCRISSVFLLLGTATLLNMAILFAPWKSEFKAASPHIRFEFSIWSVCRITPRGAACYEGELDNAPAWFLAFRWFLILAIVIQYLAAFFCIIMLVVRRNDESKFFWIASFVSLASASFILTAMVLLRAYWDFGFLEDSRMLRMGWREDADVEESNGWPRYAGYSSIGTTLFTFVFVMYTHFVDERYTKNYHTIRSKYLHNGF